MTDSPHTPEVDAPFVEIIRKHLTLEQARIGAGAKNAVTEKLSLLLVEACAAQAKQNVAPLVSAEREYEEAPRTILYTLGGKKLYTESELQSLLAALRTLNCASKSPLPSGWRDWKRRSGGRNAQ